MNSIMNRAKIALDGEQGGPSVETIIGIAVAIVMGVALIAFGNTVVQKTDDANKQIATLQTDANLDFANTGMGAGGGV